MDMCTHEIIDCGNAFALGRSFEARMGTPTIEAKYSGDTLSSDNELLLAPSSPLVQLACVKTDRDAPLLTVSTRGRVVFTKRV